MDSIEIYLGVYMLYFIIMCVLFARKSVKQSREIKRLRDQLIKKEDEYIDRIHVYCPCCGRKLEDK